MRYLALLLLFIPTLLAAGPAVTVRKIDESTTTGTLTALTDGKILLTSPTASIPLEDVVELTTTGASAQGSSTPRKLTGKYIGTVGAWQDGGTTGDKVFDGDLDTYFGAPQEHVSDAWVGLDLGKPMTITEVKYAPRHGVYAKRMIGGKVQGSSKPDFSSDVTDLLTIANEPKDNVLTPVQIAASGAFRYVRYVSKEKGCNIAELEIWGRDAGAAPDKVTKPNPNSRAKKKEVLATSKPTTAPGSAYTAYFSEDDRLRGQLVGWTDKAVTLQLAQGDGVSVEIPVTALREIWRGTTEQVAQGKALPFEPGPEDAAFVVKDNAVVSVRGVALGVDGESLKFKFNDEEKKIALAKLVGVILGGQDAKRDRSFRQSFLLAGDDAISGTWTAYDASKNTATLQTAWGKTVELPFTSVSKIRSANGRLTYLSDLKPAAVDQTPYFDRVLPYRIDKSLTGGPIKLVDGDVKRGISVHSRCVLTYDLAGEYTELKTKVGFQQPEGKLGDADVRIVGDGKTLWEALDLRGDAPKPTEVSVKVTGVKQLVLEVDFGKDGDTGDRVVWANPRLLRAAK